MSTGPRQINPQLDQARRVFNGLSRGRQIALVAAVVGILASFLHWYGASYSGAVSASTSITGWHGWGIIALLGYVVAGAVVLLPLGGMSLRGLIPSLPPTISDARVVLGAGIVSALAVILFIATEGSGVSVPGYSEGPSIGAYIGLICAVAIAVGGYLMQQEPAL